jgi:hypothetical protein
MKAQLTTLKLGMFLITPVMSAPGVRRGKAAFSQWVKGPPGYCSSRKQPEQWWR